MNIYTHSADYDVVVIGGALSGSSTALLLLRERPDLKVLILEKSPEFGRRVGEATVEVSTYFLTRVLGLAQHLNENHLVKQGLRFWFSNSKTHELDECSEIGGKYLSRVSTFQVDRAVMDEEVLRRACAAGAKLIRPCAVSRVELTEGREQIIYFKQEGVSNQVRARWVVDASGVAALLARQEGWFRQNHEHPIASVWARWKNVKDWDGLEMAQKFPKWSQACFGIRGTATNHLVGEGWWAWCIPLKGGDVSIGIVFDQRMVDLPEGGSVGARLKKFLCAHPVGQELFSEAEWIEGDVHFRRNLPYVSERFCGDGFVLVGDAAGFLDPFYSPGMDWITFTSSTSVKLIVDSMMGKAGPKEFEMHNQVFTRSYDRWFNAIYRDKYYYMGDYELMRLAFLMDLGLYYLGVASQPYKYGTKALLEPIFATAPSVPVYYLMRTYNRRFVRIAQARRARGVWGRCNDGMRFMFGGYTFAHSSSKPIIGALFHWLFLELKEGWRTWGVKIPKYEMKATTRKESMAVPVGQNVAELEG